MFNLSWTSPYKGEIKTLKLTRKPMSLGYYKDVDGNTWDVSMIIGSNYAASGKPYICARQVDMYNPYYSTGSDSNQNGFHKWIPYYYEIIENKN